MDHNHDVSSSSCGEDCPIKLDFDQRRDRAALLDAAAMTAARELTHKIDGISVWYADTGAMASIIRRHMEEL